MLIVTKKVTPQSHCTFNNQLVNAAKRICKASKVAISGIVPIFHIPSAPNFERRRHTSLKPAFRRPSSGGARRRRVEYRRERAGTRPNRRLEGIFRRDRDRDER